MVHTLTPYFQCPANKTTDTAKPVNSMEERDSSETVKTKAVADAVLGSDSILCAWDTISLDIAEDAIPPIVCHCRDCAVGI